MFIYRMFEEVLFLDECGSYRSYGICVENEMGEIVSEISDISTDKQLVSELTSRCFYGQLDPVQLRDVVLDYIDTAALPKK